jgi:ankyrin repeat protein
MDLLAAKHTPKAVRAALKSLPQKLYDTYDQTMDRIESQNDDDKQLAMRILSWIAYAKRPLTVQELQHALSVEPEQSDFDEHNLPEEELLTSVCAGLAIIDKNGNTVRLVHATAQDYFLKVREKRFPVAQIAITRTCLSYLSFDDFASFYDKKQKIEKRLQKYPFLAYAAQYWGCHARGDPERRLRNAVLRFLAQSSKVSCSIQVMYSQQRRVWSWNKCLELVPGLWVAATFGLEKIVEILAGQGANVNALSCGYTALHQAARSGYEDTVRLLVRKKADVNTRGGVGQTPLHLAARWGHENVVRLLLENGADIMTKDEDKRGFGRATVLSCAIVSENAKLVEMLVEEYGFDTECMDGHGDSAMHEAARTGSEEIVRYLMKVSPHLVSARDNNGCIPLYRAVMSQNLPVARLLLESNPGIVNIADNCGETALHLAAKSGNEELAKLLIEKCADIMARDVSGLTALHKAAFYGCEAVIRLLIGHGADIAARGNQGETALHDATIRQELEAVQLLLEKGADVTIKDDQGRTALHYAAGWGCVQLLFGKGPDIAVTDDQGRRTAFLYAIRYAARDEKYEKYEKNEKNVRLFEILLEKGADIAARDDQGETALRSAVERGHQKTVQFLLEKGADPATINIADLSKHREVLESNFQAAIRIIESRLEQPGKNNAQLPPGMF